MARQFASRLQEHAVDTGEQIDHAMQLLVQRSPDPDERQLLIDFATNHGLPNLSRLLFNLSEFVYID